MTKRRMLFSFFSILLVMLSVVWLEREPIIAHATQDGTYDGGTEKTSAVSGSYDGLDSSRFSLLKEDGTLIADYESWAGVTAKINYENRGDRIYIVVLPENCRITGNMTLPKKGKYAGIVLERNRNSDVAEDDKADLSVTGNITLTGRLTLGRDLHLAAKGISGTSWQMVLSSGAAVETGAAISVGSLSLGPDAQIKTAGKLTVKKDLEAAAGAGLILTEKKGAAIKDTSLLSEEPLSVKVQNKEGQVITLGQAVSVFTVSGDSYAPQFALEDADGKKQALYRKGSAIRVQGALETPVSLYDVTESEVYLGNYLSLADIRTEISRRKRSGATYKVVVGKAQYVKGALPLPTAKTYKKILFEGEKIGITGNITLTGELELHNDLYKVKRSLEDAPLLLTVNLSKYKLIVQPGHELANLNTVNGSTGSVLEIAREADQKINANLKADRLILGGRLTVLGTITVTDVKAGQGNLLTYDIGKKINIKGLVSAEEAKLYLAPMKAGSLIEKFTEGMKLIANVPKADADCFALLQDVPEVLYKEGAVLKIGMPVIVLFEGTTDYETCQTAEADAQFVTFNDMMAHINASQEKNFVARLNRRVPSAGNMASLGSGKHLILCGINGEKLTLQFTGGILLNDCTLEVHNLILDNKTTAGPGVTLTNGSALVLDNTEVNYITANTGTGVRMLNNVSIKSSVSGQGSLDVEQGAVIRSAGNIVVGSLSLRGEENAQFRLQTGRKLVIANEVLTGEKNCFIVNIVDKQDAPASIGLGTVLVNTQYGQVSQFKTENTMPGTFMEWSLIKKGIAIQTSEVSYGDGEWSGDYL